MELQHHPDSHELHDWPMYGPKDPEIANVVDRLAYDHGLRVREIEEVVWRALQDRLKAEEASPPARQHEPEGVNHHKPSNLLAAVRV